MHLKHDDIFACIGMAAEGGGGKGGGGGKADAAIQLMPVHSQGVHVSVDIA